MKKGEDMRARILEAAERFFYEKGYEDTSVQDILNVLSLSKGGFYHHFDSKIRLLEAICDQKCQMAAQDMEKAAEACGGDAVDVLNAVLNAGGLFRKESSDYLSLLIQVAYKGEGGVLRERMKKYTIRYCNDIMRRVVHRGIEEGVFFSRYPDEIGELLLSLFANLTDDIAEVFAGGKDSVGRLSEVLSKLNVYRHAVELLLNAPYGRILIYDMTQLYAAEAGLRQRA